MLTLPIKQVTSKVGIHAQCTNCSKKFTRNGNANVTIKYNYFIVYKFKENIMK